MEKWHLIQNQPLLREMYKDPPLISYRKGKWLEDMLVKAKTIKARINTMGTQRESRRSVNAILTKKTKTIPKSRKNRLDMYAN